MTAAAPPVSNDASPSPEDRIMSILREEEGGSAPARGGNERAADENRAARARDDRGRYARAEDAGPERRGPVLDFDEDDPFVAAERQRGEPDRDQAPPADERDEEQERDERRAAAQEQEQDDEDDRAQAQGDERDDEPKGPQMLSEIAGEYEVKPEEFLETVHIEGPDGQPVPLSDVVRGYQEAPRRIEASVAGERQRLDQARRQFESESSRRLQELDALHQELEAVVQADREPDWNRLEQEDRERYLEERTRWMQRQDVLRKVRENREREMARYAQMQQEDVQRFAREQHDILLQRRPEWRDSNRRMTALRQVDKYLREEIGFSDDQLSAPLDARMVEVAWEASEYRRLKRAANLNAKRMRRLGRTVRSGARQGEGKDAGRGRRVAQKSAALRQTGSDQAALSLLEELV